MASTDARPVPRKNTAYRVYFPILDADGDLVTGASSLDSEVSIDGGSFADCTNEATEIGSTGIYYLDLTSGEMNGDAVVVQVKTATSGAKTTPIIFYPEEVGDFRVNVEQFGGSNGTFSSGRPEVNTTHAAGTAWNSGAIGASTLASDTIAAAKIASGAITSAKFAAGAIDAAAIANGAIDAATFAADVDAEILSYIVDDATRIDASALNTLSGHDPGETIMGATDLGTGSGLTSLATAAELAKVPKSDGTVTWNASAAAQIQSEANDALVANHLDHLLAATYDPASKPGASDALLNELIESDGGVSRYTANALEQAPTGGSAPSAADIADAVWEEALTDHNGTPGSTAEALGAAGSAGDPWATTLPGSYSSGQAGKIIGDNLNATIGSRATQTSVDDLPTNAELASALSTIAAAIDDIPDALLDQVDGVETDLTVRGALRLTLAALAGKLSGANTSTTTIRNVGDTKDRIIATTDATGRTSVTTDAS